MEFILNGQPIQKVMVILTLILPKAIDVNALHFLMHLKRIIELWVKNVTHEVTRIRRKSNLRCCDVVNSLEYD